MEETVAAKPQKSVGYQSDAKSKSISPIKISEIVADTEQRIKLPSKELNRVL